MGWGRGRERGSSRCQTVEVTHRSAGFFRGLKHASDYVFEEVFFKIGINLGVEDWRRSQDRVLRVGDCPTSPARFVRRE